MDEINIDNTDDYATATTLTFYFVLNHAVTPLREHKPTRRVTEHLR
jgi:hypothetical protein